MTATEGSDDLEVFVAEHMKDPLFRAEREDIIDRHTVIDDLLERRRAAGVTQREVAEYMRVKQPTVSEFECESSDPRLSTLQRYARAVGARIRITLVEDT